jgi:hypothetical protein
MTTLLTLCTSLAAVLLLGVVALYLVLIRRELDAIGGSPTSFLAKIRFGLRAIEKETALLGPQVSKLNEGLRTLDGGLRAVEQELSGVVRNLKGEGA